MLERDQGQAGGGVAWPLWPFADWQGDVDGYGSSEGNDLFSLLCIKCCVSGGHTESLDKKKKHTGQTKLCPGLIQLQARYSEDVFTEKVLHLSLWTQQSNKCTNRPLNPV